MKTRLLVSLAQTVRLGAHSHHASTILAHIAASVVAHEGDKALQHCDSVFQVRQKPFPLPYRYYQPRASRPSSDCHASSFCKNAVLSSSRPSRCQTRQGNLSPRLFRFTTDGHRTTSDRNYYDPLYLHHLSLVSGADCCGKRPRKHSSGCHAIHLQWVQK